MESKLERAPKTTTSSTSNSKAQSDDHLTFVSTDEELVALVLAGERYRFQDLIEPYTERLYRMALSIVRIPADAEDVVQESFLKAFLNLGKFRFDARFSTWLTSIALNEARAVVKARRYIAYEPIDTCCDEGLFMDIVCKQPLPADVLEESEFRRLVARALGGLHPTYREIYDLREVEECNTETAAARIGIPIPLAKIRLRRARKMLHQRLATMMSVNHESDPNTKPTMHT
jgi:RNA polymerase sigma-70 factor (ECF subfamily)